MLTAQLTVRRRGYALGASIEGLDLTSTTSDETIAAVRKAVLDNIVVCIPGQDISPEQLKAFCGRFGELDVENTSNLPKLAGLPEVTERANKPIAVGALGPIKTPPGDNWHSDFSYTRRPSTLSFLLMKQMPDVGGETLFANLYMAYETLSPAYQKMIEPLVAIHNFTQGQAFAVHPPEEQERLRRLNPPVLRPIVRVHPETGRKALFVVDRLRCFDGMTEEESKPLLDFMKQHATRYEFIYRHRWAKDDLIIWDNRCAIHLAVQDYDQSQLRKTQRCSLVDLLGN